MKFDKQNKPCDEHCCWIHIWVFPIMTSTGIIEFSELRLNTKIVWLPVRDF